MKQRLLALGCVVLLLALFVGVGMVLRRRVPVVETALGAGQPADYVGDWQCDSASLDLHIEAQGDGLLITGLEDQPVVFGRSGPKEPFVQPGGSRRLARGYQRLRLHQRDGQTLEFRLRGR